MSAIGSVGLKNYDALLKALSSYRPTLSGVKALEEAASKVDINLNQAFAEAGLGKFKSALRGINPSLFGSKAPALYPGQAEVVAALFMKIEKQNPALAGELAAEWFHTVAKEVPIYGKQN